ncbi:bifunctional 4-hydroxy-2-oxoglutarate aldolase/2-dehydro-3-deoxy-phosphogluconate aldolase [Radiobacillus kanasensis]|uniref:bifunctional 4-hydroxy-2-oxoglutarate aldolase/2-dehydro-3-deoxy-phosphogluconate aldolase n=1 Tax=Radiobacillus kanasensis TaxID=2844358 RepID=UPI001E4C6A2A|nr:bifunctional 4-hydroxy-2-oxoglutarate aldolase/2-dehydro-3-deoxy-phosphogluconate aldolase [Radiobacillus kanasensis]UFT99233.1 bifunctional 4-hydroxy-2-oxoglutarate aldolase/2-dehydro-3-deoxy-phosphogluconate aldolase [Radiobacillus kanasensis]
MDVAVLTEVPIIPVLRKMPYEKSASIIQALVDGGIRSIEITMESEGAELMIQEAKGNFGDQIIVGAGTVVTKEDCRRAIDAGAQFVVSPILDEEVVRYAASQDVPMIPGVFTPSEMVKATQCGAPMVKVFPASVLGPEFVKDVKGPLQDIPIMCTGGITRETAKAYLDAGAVAVGAGGSLLKKDFISNGDYEGITKEARKWLSMISD